MKRRKQAKKGTRRRAPGKNRGEMRRREAGEDGHQAKTEAR